MERRDAAKWIFVSHASNDIQKVRLIRNYLEEKGAAPLLFHLLALQEPEEFWPIIEREIEARSFFLFCDSAAAQESTWVKKERDLVANRPADQPKRIGHIDVDSAEVDFTKIDNFLLATRAFPVFAAADYEFVEPYLAALRHAGFEVFDPHDSIKPGEDWESVIRRQIRATVGRGWCLLFLTANSASSQFVARDIAEADSLGARIVPIVIDDFDVQLLPRLYLDFQMIHAQRDDSATPPTQAVCNRLLMLPFS